MKSFHLINLISRKLEKIHFIRDYSVQFLFIKKYTYIYPILIQKCILDVRFVSDVLHNSQKSEKKVEFRDAVLFGFKGSSGKYGGKQLP